MHFNVYCLNPGQENPLHRHPNSAEVLYFVRGTGTCRVGEQTLRVRPGDLVLVDADQPHAVANTHAGDPLVCILAQAPLPCVHVPVSDVPTKQPTRWVTRQNVKVDRVACPWLIRRFIDPRAEFYFVPAAQVQAEARRLGATSFDCAGDELGHHGKECTFDALFKKYGLITREPALELLARIVNGADTDNSLWNQPEAAGLKAIAEGFRHLGLKDDHEILEREFIVYDALLASCKQQLTERNSHGR
ncbi:MAG: chromate resistance protein [Planctomycetes bacterium]|nr:chromate resistance protein [Planctomycetota bacterium]